MQAWSSAAPALQRAGVNGVVRRRDCAHHASSCTVEQLASPAEPDTGLPSPPSTHSRELGMEGAREPGSEPARDPPGACMRAMRRISSRRRCASRSRSRLALTNSVGSKRPAEMGREVGREPGRDGSAERDLPPWPAPGVEQAGQANRGVWRDRPAVTAVPPGLPACSLAATLPFPSPGSGARRIGAGDASLLW